MKNVILILAIAVFILTGCQTDTKKENTVTFKDDLEFLEKHTEVIVLAGENSDARIIIVPAWQGRIVTSTSGGDKGTSFGWINRELIASGEVQQHINVFGGEDRFWLGPEGGQFSIFFKPGVPFDFENWFTPAEIDTKPFELVSKTNTSAMFEKNMSLTNYSGNVFNLKVNRNINLLDQSDMVSVMGFQIDKDLKTVAFESENVITNTGESEWTKETGMLSIWILGMFNPSPSTTVVLRYKEGTESALGNIVTDDYFGKIAEDRLKIKDGIIYFKADGNSRGKIGISPGRAVPVAGSYDAENNVLTIVRYTLPAGAEDYVNSLWKLQEKPFAGDAVNSYNDGPLDDGSILGPFYELESSSPAAALAPGKEMKHYHTTLHFTGDKDKLDTLAEKVFGVGLAEIEAAF